MIDKRCIFIIIIAVLIFVMLMFNRKVSLKEIISSQLETYKNAEKERISVWDLCCFIVFPIIISILIVFGLQYRVSDKLAETLTTVFSLVFSILFGFAAIIVERKEINSEIKKQVIGETFASIVDSTVFSLLAAIISILIIQTESEKLETVLSVILLSVSFHIIMLLLMITKRTFAIYSGEDESDKKK